MAAAQSLTWPPSAAHDRRPAFGANGNRTESAEAWKPLSAIRERIGVVLVGLLIFSTLLAIAGFVASYDGRRKAGAFESDGHSAIGTVTEKNAPNIERAYWTGVFTAQASDRVYQMKICFRMQGQGLHCGTVGVPYKTYDGLRVGSPLRVTYVPWRPDWFYVGDDAPDDRDSDVFTRMFQLCTIADLLIIIVLAAMVFWREGNGVTGRTVSGPQANDVASHFRQRHGYGRRRGLG